MIYKIGSKGLERTDVPENHKKNQLAVGTILQLNGYSNPRYVIVKNLGVSERFNDYGSRYLTVKLDDFSFSQHDAFSMDHIDDKKDNRIHMYYTDEVLPGDEVLAIWEKAKLKEQAEKEAYAKAAEINKERETRGRELFAKFIPETAQAVIVAECEIDKCDLQTDYFATSTSQTVILGWSKHKRDIFSEMRKYADRIPETAHLKESATVDSNHEPKTESNKSWWHPADEHREKYSMGHGYYLKAEGRYSSGWLVRKIGKYNSGWSEHLFRSLADRCVLSNLKRGSKMSAEQQNTKIKEAKTNRTVSANVNMLIGHNRSMAVALEKAENGSFVEDMYFLEKLQKTANLLGYELKPIGPETSA